MMASQTLSDDRGAATGASDPSMREVLASIRRILSGDDAAPHDARRRASGE